MKYLLVLLLACTADPMVQDCPVPDDEGSVFSCTLTAKDGTVVWTRLFCAADAVTMEGVILAPTPPSEDFGAFCAPPVYPPVPIRCFMEPQ